MHTDFNGLDFQLFDALRRANRILRAQKPRRDSACSGPAAKREIVLAILSEHEGGLRQNQLAAAFRVSPSTLSEMLNRLEEDGLIARTPDPSDRRATLMTLTDQGADRACQIKEDTQRVFVSVFGGLTDDEKQQLTALLLKISDPDKAE